MKTIFTDASFDWHFTNSTEENIVRGKIAIADGNSFARIEKVAIGKVDGLQQYINILELTAIARAVELACDMKIEDSSLSIYTDSQTAMFWARNGIKNKSLITEAHTSALEYLKRVRVQFGGIITFNFIHRDENPAGLLLAEELEREKPHEL